MKSRNAMTKEQLDRLKQLLQSAKETGASFSDINRGNPEFPMHIILYYNKMWNIIPINERKTYSDEQKLAILNFAKDHGVMQASRHFNIHNEIIVEWNNEMHVYQPRQRARSFSEAEIIKILNEACEYSFRNDGAGGISAVCKKHQLRHQTVYNWNSKYKIIPTRQISCHSRISPQEIEYIARELPKYKTITEASRHLDRSVATLKAIMKQAVR